MPRAGTVHPTVPDSMFRLGAVVLRPDKLLVLNDAHLSSLVVLDNVPWNATVVLGIPQFLHDRLFDEHPDSFTAACWCDHEGVLRYWSCENRDRWYTKGDIDAIDAALLRDAVDDYRAEQADGGV